MINKIEEEVIEKIKMKTPYGHTARPYEEGMNEEQIKGLFYKGLTDEKTSVVAEINRIVKEINEESKKSFPPDAIGTIEIMNTEAVPQPEGLVTDYALFLYDSPSIIDITEIRKLTQYKYTLTSNEKYLVLRITAPEGVVPDNDLMFMQRGQGVGGITLLASASDEVYDGYYYLNVPVHMKSPIEVIKLKWNGEAYTSFMIIDLKSLISTDLSNDVTLYKKYSKSDSEGVLYDELQEDSKYVGLYVGDEESTNFADYTWIPLSKEESSSKGGFRKVSAVLDMDQWSDGIYTLKLEGVTSDSVVIVSPSPTYMGLWAENGVYCSGQYADHLRFYADTTPEKNIDVNILIGEGL